MLSVENLEAGYGDVQVLWGISLHVEEREIVALLGSNGAGKTTTLRTISGLLKPMSGRITFDGVDITGRPAHEIVRLGISMVPEGRRLFPKMTVYENLRMGAYLAKGDVRDRLETVYSLFPILRERRNQLAGTLSGGEQQMLAIARGLMSSPKLLMLDEPSLGLAPKIVQEVLSAVRQIREEGVTILLVEQNVQQALSIADRGYVIETGRIVLEGSGKELLQNDHVRTAYLGL